jgi:hypothetical protein
MIHPDPGPSPSPSRAQARSRSRSRGDEDDDEVRREHITLSRGLRVLEEGYLLLSSALPLGRRLVHHCLARPCQRV